MVAINVATGPDGQRSYSFKASGSSPLPMSMYGIWALPQGIPMGAFSPGWYPSPERPHPACIQIIIASDQRAMWGRKCPECAGYWRTAAPGLITKAVCPYCGARLEAHECLSDAQLAYVESCCALFEHVRAMNQDGEFSIRVKDLIEQTHASEGGEKPAPPEFFVEVTRQTRFTCEACGTQNDILGRFGYCSACGTRNDVEMLEQDIESIRKELNAGSKTTTALKEAVDVFDAVGRNLARQLVAHVPMTPARRQKWERANFQQIEKVAEDLRRDFDVDMLKKIGLSEVSHAKLMFHRRHVYTHNGATVDQKYIDDSGDTSVSVGQLLKGEKKEDIIKMTQTVVKMTRNLRDGFHSIIPVEAQHVSDHAGRKPVR